jgi:nucleoside-diphosphate-sugar epimerase
MATTHLIVGAGAVGTATAHLLVEAGHQVRLATRSGSGPVHPAIERIALDASDPAAVTRAAQGAAAIYNCANPPYTRWPTLWPPIAAALLAAAEATGAVLATTSNLYAYGPVTRPMTEELPLAATGHKGRTRARMWLDAVAAHEAGRVRATEVRASDFYGPNVGNAMLGNRAIERLLAGKSVQLLGNPDALHSVTYVPDVARLLVTVAADERAWGRPWHVPTAPALTARDTVHLVARIAGVDRPKVVAPPAALMNLIGLVVPTVRELRETAHQFTNDWVLDSSAAERMFGLAPTPLADGARATVDAARGAAPAGRATVA